ncbi:CrcB family protein [Nesterenkonia sp. E16_7]|uniref:CrcB family protein n=1 Tax=unclassified Nesterenkonia TaxID=2629769 RepID=UPI001A93494E|nr:CrcB family protein [Nesterenkonia sp. E16_10]MBO0598722.1 CrcB family protein [Nesterenkonia sp. E16_7]
MSSSESSAAGQRSRPGRPATPLPVLILLVGLAGACGALMRLLIGELIPEQGMKFPWTTLAINLSGSGLLGLLIGAAMSRPRTPDWVVPTFGTGLLASYTTFSAVILAVMPSIPGSAYDGLAAVTYVSPGAMEMLTYLLLSILGCTAAAAAGLTISRALFGQLGAESADLGVSSEGRHDS